MRLFRKKRNLDNKLITCSLFLDLSKAFDCCDHEILLDKLYHYGIRSVSHKLFSNFLHNTMQYTKIRAFKSSYKRISCGVSQGSVILPLVFLIYINDITKASSFHTTLFADDINLHISNSSFNVLQTTVNLELCKIDHCLRANKLSLNYNKTNFMLLTSRKYNPASFKAVVVNLFCIGTPFRICSKSCTPLPCTKIYYCKSAKFKRFLRCRRCFADFKW